MVSVVGSWAEPLIRKTYQNKLENNSLRFYVFRWKLSQRRNVQDQIISFTVVLFFFNRGFVCIKLPCLTIGMCV